DAYLAVAAIGNYYRLGDGMLRAGTVAVSLALMEVFLDQPRHVVAVHQRIEQLRAIDGQLPVSIVASCHAKLSKAFVRVSGAVRRAGTVLPMGEHRHKGFGVVCLRAEGKKPARRPAIMHPSAPGGFPGSGDHKNLEKSPTVGLITGLMDQSNTIGRPGCPPVANVIGAQEGT